MAMDGVMLSFVVEEMQQLVGSRIDKVNQPESDMLLLSVRAPGSNHKLMLCASPSYARVQTTKENYVNPVEAPMFCMLMRKYLSGGRIMKISQVKGDRVLYMAVENRDELGDAATREIYLELMGRHSNLTLVQDGRIVDAIRHVSYDMSRVRQALPGIPFVMPPEQDKLEIAHADEESILARLRAAEGRLDKALSDMLSGVGPVTAREIAFRLTGAARADVGQLDIPDTAKRLCEFLHKLPELKSPRVLYDEKGVPKDIFPFLFLHCPPDMQREYPSLSAAMDAYYAGRDRRERINQKSATLRHVIKNALERDEKKLALQEEELTASARMEEWRIAGELLTAQGYMVPRGQSKVELPNFYDENGGAMTIDLDVALTPAQNAQKYFKKYRKARSAMHLAAEQKEKTLAEITVLEQAMADLATCETEDELNDVRLFLIENGVLRAQPQKKGSKRPPVSLPHHYVSSDGLDMYVGKNSIQNERLTHDAQGNDLWLHAKDMPGSHVIVKCSDGACPESTLMQAAKLASFYSKGRGMGVPVDYTLRKYVKKPGGTPSGFVIYTHQKTLIVDATEGDIAAIREIK
ncbi:MAG: fibronectin/fibrinogen-binding protein [Clostridiales bacterium]|nr:fibronectin/fibrinogen-binding protein [Clostridiales bacterium]